ncbi:MAG: imidazoleglycerol-phosphate dehydratase HisB [Tenericutes bacterium]|jgi:imidazoleglycerol-phosphate dehydratase|nr:imidazoleglycerol-phosphate dehydratase HisB [Mycoplasmatota bacterium]
MRKAVVNRNTLETKIELNLNIDGTRTIDIQSGIPFFDHMLTLFAFHANFDLKVIAKGDLEVDDHHTIEDIGLALGQALFQALGDKRGINRYGLSYLPMDETLSRAVIDISNRPFLVFKAIFNRDKVGTMDTQNVFEFFKSFVNESRLNLHIENLYGENEHHKIESMFKAFGRALKEACLIVDENISSTKGVL